MASSSAAIASSNRSWWYAMLPKRSRISGRCGWPGRRERQRGLVAGGGRCRIQSPRAVTGSNEEVDRLGLVAGSTLLLTGRTRELQGVAPMIGEDVGEIVRALAQLRLQPRGCRRVAFRPRAARQLPVGNVAPQHVPERILLLASHAALHVLSDKALLGQVGQGDIHSGAVLPIHGHQRTVPEDLADHGGIAHERLPINREGVQAGGQQTMDGGRDRKVDTGAEPGHAIGFHQEVAIAEQCHILLGVERIAIRPLHDGAGQFRWHHAAEQRRDQSGRVFPSTAAQASACAHSAGRRRSQDACRGTPVEPWQAARAAPVVDSRAASSRNASRASSAQCRSSITTTAGPLAASPSRKARHAAKDSSRLVWPDSTPTSGRSRSWIQVESVPRGMTAASLACTTDAGSDSRMPASALTISPSAQKVMPSP